MKIKITNITHTDEHIICDRLGDMLDYPFWGPGDYYRCVVYHDNSSRADMFLDIPEIDMKKVKRFCRKHSYNYEVEHD